MRKFGLYRQELEESVQVKPDLTKLDKRKSGKRRPALSHVWASGGFGGFGQYLVRMDSISLSWTVFMSSWTVYVEVWTV